MPREGIFAKVTKPGQVKSGQGIVGGDFGRPGARGGNDARRRSLMVAVKYLANIIAGDYVQH